MASAAQQRSTGIGQLTTTSALTESDLGSAAQRERRTRMLDATIALATQGGYDAVQMRAVAENADVALGTLYRYFPSKIHLLVCGLAREFEQAQANLDRTEIPGDTPGERVLFVLSRVTRMLQRYSELTEAMTRAFMFADATAAAEVDVVGNLMTQMFAKAMTKGEPPSAEHEAIARVIGDVWLANLVAWVTRRASASDVKTRLELTVHLLLDQHPMSTGA
jgi:TetR/AcrR family transcriptional regulator, cholesterol catabolism regulator